MFRAIIFDLDDTLYPEQSFVFSGFQAVAQWIAKRLDLDESVCFDTLTGLFHRGVRGDTFNRFLTDIGTEAEELIPEMVKVYRTHHPLIQPYPDVIEVLSKLGNRYSLGLLSDGYLDVQQRKLEALKLEKHFKAVVFSDELGREHWKPDPEPFRLVCAKLGIESNETVYVGDNPVKDFLGARNAGMKSIRIRRENGLHIDEEPSSKQASPDAKIRTLYDLEKIILFDLASK